VVGGRWNERTSECTKERVKLLCAELNRSNSNDDVKKKRSKCGPKELI
jgi:hypothetical protein